MTGGSRGIGGAISTLLAEDGATVAVLGLPEDEARTHRLAAHLNGAASRIDFYETDVSVYDRCREAVADVLDSTAASIISSTMRGSRATTRSAR